ncbi:MAG: PEP-CTERM sorting domain-containing protein [Phycisphaerae bacterium]
MRLGFNVSSAAMLLAAASVFTDSASAATIIATWQNNGDPTHNSGNYYYSIDTSTGIATPISPLLTGGSPAGLAGTPEGSLLGFSGGRIGQVDPFAGTFTPVGVNNGLSITGLDIIHDGRAFAVPVSGTDRRLHQVDRDTSAATPVGPAGFIGQALDSFYGVTPGTTQTFIIGAGSVARTQNLGTPANPNLVTVSTIYGVHLQSNGNQLVAINPDSGFASVVGELNSVGTSGNPGAGAYSGFAAMTGVDTTGDGLYDQLFGNVNFFDPDAAGPLPSQRLGGVARYDLTDGTWTLVGTNPGLIFFGFGSVVPEPAALSLLAGACVIALRRRRA